MQEETIFLIVSSCALNISVKSSFIISIDIFCKCFSVSSTLLLSSFSVSVSLFSKSSFLPFNGKSHLVSSFFNSDFVKCLILSCDNTLIFLNI